MTCKKLRHLTITAFLLASTLLVAQGTGSKDAQVKPADVQGPHGSLRIKGISGHDFVYLNGASDDFKIGRVDEIKGDGVLLPPGQQHVIIVNPDGNRQVYSGYVIIVPNQRATLYVDKSDTRYEKWSENAQLRPLPSAGPTTAEIAPVSGHISAYPELADCGQPVRLVWTSTGYNTLLKLDGVAVGRGGASGEQIVDPRKDTTYLLEAFGPGGVYTTPVTVHVNNRVRTSLSTAPSIVRYHRIGDKVVDAGSATLNWSATNAQSVVLDPFGPVTGSSGEKDISFAPRNDGFGPIDEKRTYRITATNDCGGSDSSTALVEVAGSIDPPITPDVLPPKLPQTSSPLPLVGLIGLGSLAASFILRKIRKS